MVALLNWSSVRCVRCVRNRTAARSHTHARKRAFMRSEACDACEIPRRRRTHARLKHWNGSFLRVAQRGSSEPRDSTLPEKIRFNFLGNAA